MLATDPVKPCGTAGNIMYRSGQGSTVASFKPLRKKAGTFRQQIVRRQFAGLAFEWTNALTGAQKTAWATFAAGIGENTSGCAAVQKNGYQWWLAINVPRGNARTRTGNPNYNTVQAPATADRGGAGPEISSIDRQGADIRVLGTKPATADAREALLITIGYTGQIDIAETRRPWPLTIAINIPGSQTSWGVITSDVSPPLWLSEEFPATGDIVPTSIYRMRLDGRPSFAKLELITVGTF